MVNPTIDLTEVTKPIETVHNEGATRAGVLFEWARTLARQGIESLLSAELTVLLERTRQ